MGRINILPAKVYNRIAAGEVVERPSSVVKELVENSIDAGATEIEIYIEQGGKQLIRVIDNGCGIEREDLQSAFLPHATSKISKAEDLENIVTLGFRGEAVASIASVSKMTIKSKTEKGKCYSLSSNGGEMGQIVEDSGNDGTDVSVEMLFFNVPVRLKFLKTDKGEESYVTSFVSHLICSRPEIAFTYYVDGKRVLQSFGGGMEEAVAAVYGASVLNNCYQIDAEKHGIRIRGFIGNPNYSKANKTYQVAFLNGRYVVNGTINTAIAQAYQSYLMKRQYPFYVLYFDIPTQIVDVNVHPNKSDVRFADNGIIFGCIKSVISSILDGQPKALEYIVKRETFTPVQDEEKNVYEFLPTLAPVNGTEETKKQETYFTYEEAKREIEETFPNFKPRLREDQLPFPEEADKPRKGFTPTEEIGQYVPPKQTRSRREGPKNMTDAEKLNKHFPDIRFKRQYLTLNDPAYEQEALEEGSEDYFAENKKYLASLEGQKQDKIDVSSCVYAGKLFNTYLMYERGDDVYIIDQHAAHERLIFNRLKEQMQNRSVIKQPMLVPYVLELNSFEGEFIRERIEDIRFIGFDIEEKKENVFHISSVPLDLQDIDLAKFFNDILGDVGGYRAIKLEDILKDKLATAACKAAVKGGMDLTKTEIDALFALMDGDMRLKCPHGRPVVVKWTKKELEKMFKRIV